MIQREHMLQTAVKVFVGRAVAAPHRFLAFDRSKRQSMLQHIREKERGVAAGCPDTVLLAEGRAVWVELKAAKGKLSPDQITVGQDIQAAGSYWGCAHSVTEYLGHLKHAGVPVSGDAALLAFETDEKLAARIAKKEAAVGKAPGKPRARKASNTLQRTMRIADIQRKYGLS